MKKVIQPFYTAFVLLTFLVCLLLAFPAFVLLGVWNNSRARKAIWYIVRYWSVGWLAFIGMPIRVSGYPRDGRRYVIVANHISYLDTVDIYAAIPGYFRTLAKKEMAAIPIFGFVYKQLVILVDRSSAYSRAKSMRLMWKMLHNECSITVFPEGTFNETPEPLKSFYDGAFKLALSTQVPVLPLILPDTDRRWHYSGWWKLWPGRNRAIFLPPIEVAGMDVKDLPILKEKVAAEMAEALKEYDYPSYKPPGSGSNPNKA